MRLSPHCSPEMPAPPPYEGGLSCPALPGRGLAFKNREIPPRVKPSAVNVISHALPAHAKKLGRRKETAGLAGLGKVRYAAAPRLSPYSAATLILLWSVSSLSGNANRKSNNLLLCPSIGCAGARRSLHTFEATPRERLETCSETCSQTRPRPALRILDMRINDEGTHRKTRRGAMPGRAKPR